MDEIVKQAMAKWPNVPHCYGWLALDARGHWRMRDERAQQLKLPGDKLSNPALVGFINRNYLADARGCWYFQNGPQRVYVALETTPFVARTDPEAGLLLHTGEPAGPLDWAGLTEIGEVLVRAGGRLAQIDDRDVASLLGLLRLEGAPLADDGLLDWLAAPRGRLQLTVAGQTLEVEALERASLPARFGYVQHPQPA
ncbi:DUF2946 family protein [Massilia sp. TS11]|uniref:DUF2946 family protein n=1 Tax=Massilia sp. TS11 TaxID=2908003 RepID=UPI001EDC6C84|nr:DUF2946 family protein [Massilia sp. TS11]MCG2586437.1 DUF2946 family protein [Massilia sp. TS11]